jgi:hypothetical protein
MMIKNFFFFTATILNWFKVLENDSYKDVIIESFRYLVDENRVKIFAFVKGKVCITLFENCNSLFRKLLGTPTTAKRRKLI